MNQSLDISTLLKNVSRIKLPGGMVGKVCTVLIVVAISMGSIAWAVRSVWLGAIAVVLLFTLCIIVLLKVIDFANRNPQAAILEGAEFLIHEQLMLGTKANPKLLIDIKEYIEAKGVVLSTEDRKKLSLPDPSPGQTGQIAQDEQEENNG